MTPTDRRQPRAARLLRKLLALGIDETGIVALLKSESVSTGSKRPAPRASSNTTESGDVYTRLSRAQYVVRQLMAAGFIESDIAAMSGVSPGSISHIIEPGSCRSVSPQLLGGLERALQTSGWERLKTLVPRLPISVLDTCNLRGAEVTRETLTGIEERLPRMLLRALIPGFEPGSPPEGINGVLARIGNPKHEMYLLKLWSFPSSVANEEIARLQLLEHELEHVVSRVRERRSRLEKNSGAKVSRDRMGGNIA